MTDKVHAIRSDASLVVLALGDREGKVALCAMESQEYRRLVQGAPGGPQVLKALRSQRA